MAKLCIATYVFKAERSSALDYSEYIPLYAYSIFRSYPDYHVRIYLNGKLSPEVRKAIGLVENMGSLTVIENYTVPGVNYIHKSIRWLMFDDAFYQYDAIYIGDIDFFICPEQKGIYEIHMEHCEYLNLPYSNMVRSKPYSKGTSLRHLLYCFSNFNIGKILQYLMMDFSKFYRLSGLHFVQTGPYYEKVLPVIPRLIEELNDLYIRRNLYFNPCVKTFDEHILYRLVGLAGLPYPGEISADNNNGGGIILGRKLDADDEKLKFRPHHGIHLGIFRNENDGLKKDEILLNGDYVVFYKYFCRNQKSESILNELIKLPLLKETITRMHGYYKQHGILE